jgi:ATP-dependent 26S proteasome regulatory subunit
MSVKSLDRFKDDSSDISTVSSSIETVSFSEYIDSVSGNTSASESSQTEYVCLKCNTFFKNKQTLNLHKKTVKCTNLNKEDNESKKMCEFCNKKFASKQMKNYHLANCVEKIKHELNIIHKNEIDNIVDKFTKEIENMKISFQNEIEKLKK